MLAGSYSLTVYATLVFFVFFKVVVYGHLNDMLWRKICLLSIRFQVLHNFAELRMIVVVPKIRPKLLLPYCI